LSRNAAQFELLIAVENSLEIGHSAARQEPFSEPLILAFLALILNRANVWSGCEKHYKYRLNSTVLRKLNDLRLCPSHEHPIYNTFVDCSLPIVLAATKRYFLCRR
jgi:hypothetical protein